MDFLAKLKKLYITLSLVITVPVLAPVHPSENEPINRDNPGTYLI